MNVRLRNIKTIVIFYPVITNPGGQKNYCLRNLNTANSMANRMYLPISIMAYIATLIK